MKKKEFIKVVEQLGRRNRFYKVLGDWLNEIKERDIKGYRQSIKTWCKLYKTPVDMVRILGK